MPKTGTPRHLVSTVIPVYNVEKYLEATIDSVINQSIDFQDNVQLLLIDDGSQDNSSVICKKYAQLFPENVQYIRQENSGVAAARNRGYSEADGQYVHFLDSDDIISDDFYQKATQFLSDHAEEIDFVSTKIKFFDANIDQHPNNYKFHSTRVIDVEKEPDSPILHVSSCLFRCDALGAKKFDTKLTIAEDAKFVSDVLRDKRAYGVLAESCLHYRKRSDGSSAINGQFKNKSFYTITPDLFMKYLLDSWSDDSGKSALYAQCVLLYELKWRLKQSRQDVLTAQEERVYKQKIKDLILRLDDEAIAMKRDFPLHMKRYIFNTKYGSEWSKRITLEKDKVSIDGNFLFNPASDTIHIDFMSYTDESTWQLEGYADKGAVVPGTCLILRVGDDEFLMKWVPRSQRKVSFLGDVIYDGGAFEGEVVASLQSRNASGVHMSAHYRLPDGTLTNLSIRTNRFTGLSVLPLSYRCLERAMLRKERGGISFYKPNWWRTVKFEMTYLGVIALNWRMHTLKERIGRLRRYNLAFLTKRQKIKEMLKPFAFSVEAIAMIPRAFLLRLTYRLVKPYVNGPIWIISDRGMAAGDNGEALFRYLQTRNELKANVYFAIAKKSADYARMRQIGKVVDQNSLYYKLLFLLSDKIISSQADIETTNPFIRQIDHYVDLFQFEFVFLQHGIIRHDLSGWLNRFEKNIQLFVTSAQMEYDSILKQPYYYNKKNVVLSGLPRYDLLESDAKGKLILAPTYRKNIVRIKTNKNGARKYDSQFKYSDYRNFYNDFMNDKRIIEALESRGMQGELYLHPVFEAQARDFTSNNVFTVKTFPYNYADAFREGSLMVSDYSSVVFDFAYLKKPIIYAQFDREGFFGGHSYDVSEFFQDARDGFGPVTLSYDDLVQETVAVISSGCTMEATYKKRVDEFFYKSDKHNSQRVYEAILKLDSEKRV